jgi:hypothetical protein
VGSAGFGARLHIDHLGDSVAPSVYIFQPVARRARFARRVMGTAFWEWGKLPSHSAASGIALRSDHREAFASAGSPLPGLMSPCVLASTGEEGKAFQRAKAIAPLSGSLTVSPATFSISPRMQAEGGPSRQVSNGPVMPRASRARQLAHVGDTVCSQSTSPSGPPKRVR